MDAYPVAQFSWLGLTWYGFGLALSAGGVLAFAVLLLEAREEPRLKAGAGQLMALSVALGLVCARLAYAIFSWQLVFLDPMDGAFLGLTPLFQVNLGGLSFYGMLLGVLLACLLHAWLSGHSAGAVFDLAALPLGLFSAFALGAQILGGAGFGEEVAPWLNWFPAAVRNAYEEWNAAVFIYQAATALLISLLLVRRRVTALPGDRMLRLLIPLNALQLFFEALRQDDYPRLAANGFIRVNQLLALAFLVGAALVLTRRQSRSAPGLWLSLLAAVGVAMAAEFNEKLPLPREALYFCSFAAMVGLSLYWLRALGSADAAATAAPQMQRE